MFELDSQEKIVLAKTYSIIGKYFRHAISESGDGEIILRCAGLSSLVDDYRTELTPYYMNGTWKNDNPDLIQLMHAFQFAQKLKVTNKH